MPANLSRHLCDRDLLLRRRQGQFKPRHSAVIISSEERPRAISRGTGNSISPTCGTAKQTTSPGREEGEKRRSNDLSNATTEREKMCVSDACVAGVCPMSTKGQNPFSAQTGQNPYYSVESQDRPSVPCRRTRNICFFDGGFN